MLCNSAAAATNQDNRQGTARAEYFPSIYNETRSHVTTACAAYWLNRKAQTLRKWACYEDGPIRPVRINGRLAWSVTDLTRILAEGSA